MVEKKYPKSTDWTNWMPNNQLFMEINVLRTMEATVYLMIVNMQ